MSSNEWVPKACTLPTVEQPIRVAEFDALFQAALRTVNRPAPEVLVLTLATVPGRAETVRALTSRESECCSFFTFTLVEGDGVLVLQVAVPTVHVDVLDAIELRAVKVSGLAP